MKKKTGADKPLIVYVHIPLCPSKCHFCDWVTGIPVRELLLEPQAPLRTEYIRALCAQIRYHAPRLRANGYRPAILYFGGGTASLLEVDEFLAIMETLHDVFDLSALREATMECSPETLTRGKIDRYREHGFDRLSVGVQSMRDEQLRRFGRSHTAADVESALHLAAEAGFTQVNIDLISGFPGETVEDFERTLNQVMPLPFSHVCLYPYRPVPGTVLFRQISKGRQGKIMQSEQLRSYRAGRERLLTAGYSEYALSHFGAPRCHSDMAYFTLEMDWIGFGSGATSLLNGCYSTTGRGRMAHFIETPHTFDEEISAASPSVTSRLFYQSLTTPEGVVRELWEERLHTPLEEILVQPAVRSLVRFFQRFHNLTEEWRGIRIEEKTIAEAFINLLFMNQPQNARSATEARNALGGY